jgi:hypothetical protein
VLLLTKHVPWKSVLPVPVVVALVVAVVVKAAAVINRSQYLHTHT